MKIVAGVNEMRQLRAILTSDSVGFVPTMGYLHEGHLSLIRQAQAENQHVVASIFVNPTQFAPHEDLARYPRDLERDLALLRSLGLTAVFVPTVEEMYPQGLGATSVLVGGPSAPLEGAMRPGHFAGVATVVTKLFNIVQPTRAYFGQKDAQQLAVIRQMVRDLNIPVEIVAGPTVRENDGLAMSSRNVFLSPDDRATARLISRGLFAALALWNSGERNAYLLERAVREVLGEGSFRSIDYVALVDPASFLPFDGTGRQALIAVAARVGTTRLIDNVLCS